MSGPEKQFENQIKRWLESEGIYKLGTPADKMTVPPCGYYEKRLGSAMTGAGKPDLLIVVKGCAIEVEIKAENGRVSPLQKFTLLQIKRSGGCALVIYPKDFETLKTLIWGIKS